MYSSAKNGYGCSSNELTWLECDANNLTKSHHSFDIIEHQNKNGDIVKFCGLLRKSQLYLVYVDGYQEAKYGLIYNSPWIIKTKKKL